jgi:PAS domain S-box-containing protein
MDEKLRKSGIGVIGDAPWGTHLCQFYESKEDLLDILVPYFRAGLENNEFCVWVTSELVTEEAARNAVEHAMPAGRDLRSEQIEIIPHTNWYLRDDRVFESRRVVKGWMDRLNEALSNGYEGMRVAGDLFWLGKEHWEDFAHYEDEIDKVIEKNPILAVCSYSLAGCETGEVIDALRKHKSALFKCGGKWKLMEHSGAKKKAQDEDETRFRLITENARELICMVSLDGRYLYASPSMGTILGYDTEELLTRRFTDLIHSEDLSRLPFWQNMSLIEFRARKADGNLIWMEGSSNVVLYRGELVVNIVARDVTRRKQSEKEIESLSRQNELILNSAGEGIFGIDLQGNHTFVNSSAAALLGYRVKELVGKPSHIICHHSRADGSPYPEEECPIYAAYKDGIIRRVKNEVFWKKDGTSFPIAYTSTPIVERGKLIGAVVTFRDITERTRTEEELRKHRKQLKKLVEERTSELSVANELLHEQISKRKRTEEALELLADELKRSGADLQQCAHTASHDPQETVRAVAGFVRLLEERCREMLNDKATRGN